MIHLFCKAPYPISEVINLALTAGGKIISAVMDGEFLDHIEVMVENDSVVVEKTEKIFNIYLNNDILDHTDIARLTAYLTQLADMRIG